MLLTCLIIILLQMVLIFVLGHDKQVYKQRSTYFQCCNKQELNRVKHINHIQASIIDDLKSKIEKGEDYE